MQHWKAHSCPSPALFALLLSHAYPLFLHNDGKNYKSGIKKNKSEASQIHHNKESEKKNPPDPITKTDILI